MQNPLYASFVSSTLYASTQNYPCNRSVSLLYLHGTKARCGTKLLCKIRQREPVSGKQACSVIVTDSQQRYQMTNDCHIMNNRYKQIGDLREQSAVLVGEQGTANIAVAAYIQGSG
jgi:hypothetical protein